jgi:exodeoxyribonuclease VII large subunit
VSDRFPAAENDTGAAVYSVSQLNREARELLENGLPGLWVEGEISNMARPGSGHLYFSLKDRNAQISCAMFRSANRKLTFKPENGTQVVVQGRISIYEPRGSYQLIIERMEEAGEGILRRKFEELKRQLSEEGLFDSAHKQPLPDIPASIGVVTSPTGAAIRDILHVLARRHPAAKVIIYPTRVQGDGAHLEITRAIQLAEQRNECDVLIVARGGGSLEDLWSFNEETVGRAIFDCTLPIVSGVGHEVDFTIADLVADLRAPTPSGAAELITPDSAEVQRTLAAFSKRITLAAQRLVSTRRQSHELMLSRLQRSHPGAVLRQMQQSADELTRQLEAALQTRLLNHQLHYQNIAQRLLRAAPRERIQKSTHLLSSLKMRLANATQQRLQEARSRLALAAGELQAISPLATLERGYAVARDSGNGKVLVDAANSQVGDSVEIRLAKGMLEAVISNTREK